MRHYCDNCCADVTDIRVKCAECVNFDLCLQCFSCGAEIGKHKKAHDYQIINYGNFPLYPNEKGWTAGEDIEFLEKVTRYGLGNWEKIAEIMEKTPKEVEDHFKLYLEGNIGQATWSTAQVPTIKDHTDTELDIQNSTNTKKSKSCNLSSDDCLAVGYMPLRNEFEEEYDDNAEALLCHLSENEEDDDLDKALKCAKIQIYNKRLRKRIECKRVVEEYDLVSEFLKEEDKLQNSKTTRSSSGDASEMRIKMRPFCRFHSSLSHQQLISNIHRHRRVKARIKELMRYRRNGITKLDDTAKFERARNKQLKSKENKKKISSPSSSQRHLSNTESKKEKKSVDTSSRQEKGGDHSKYKENIGHELLSRSEKKLCSSIRIKSSHYITLKAQLLKERRHKAKGILHKFPLPSGLSKADLQEVVAFFVRCGWLKNG